MIRVIYIAILLILTGCSTGKGRRGRNKTGPKIPTHNEATLKEFRKGQKLLEDEKYVDAGNVFNKILVQHPTSKFHIVVLFNSGSAYEGQGNCGKAAKRFRKVSRLAINKYPRIEAQALLRLSYAYDCLGKPTKTTVTLVDVLKRKKYLPVEVGKAEVPARLAASYAQLGNTKLAESFFRQAEKGLVTMQQKGLSAIARRELLARTLYLMGNIKRSSLRRVGAAKYISSVVYLQKYLLKSVEMGSKKWSHKAAAKLMVTYQDIWDQLRNIENLTANSKGERKRVKKQVKIAELAYSSLQALKASRFPGDLEEPLVVELFRSMNSQEIKFRNFLASNVVGTDLTPEAKKLQGLKREGRSAGRPSVLERRRVRDQRLPEKIDTKDPNL